MRNGEEREVRVRLARWQVIVGIVESSQVGGTHRVAHKADANAAAVTREQVVHGGGPRGRRGHLIEEVGCGIRERSAKPLDPLVGLGFIHEHRIAAAAAD